jgi:hypothetical protein
MKSLRLAALAAALVLGACSTASPTDPAASASQPSFEGGSSLGSGNGVGTGSTEDGGNTIGSGNGVGTMGSGGGAGLDGGTMTTTSDTTQRGGSSLGSGN